MEPVLTEGSVHVWQASLDLSDPELERLNNTLSMDEKQRAERFVFEKDRQHFIAARGILRDILSRYTKIPAHELVFAYTEHGKPFLSLDTEKCKKSLLPLRGKGGAPNFQLQFNVSHSHGLALYALTLNKAVGVDLELVNTELDGLSIAQRFFTEREAKVLANLPQYLQQQYFFNYWTLKEAVVKAIGSGLFLSLDQFEVSCLPGKLPVLTEVQGSVDKAADWTICFLEVKEGYQGALAVLSKIKSLGVFKRLMDFD